MTSSLFLNLNLKKNLVWLSELCFCPYTKWNHNLSSNPQIFDGTFESIPKMLSIITKSRISHITNSCTLGSTPWFDSLALARDRRWSSTSEGSGANAFQQQWKSQWCVFSHSSLFPNAVTAHLLEVTLILFWKIPLIFGAPQQYKEEDENAECWEKTPAPYFMSSHYVTQQPLVRNTLEAYLTV